MKVGVTGHQKRENLDWGWVHDELFRQLTPLSLLTGFSSLASGADQTFADIVVKLGGKLRVILPFAGYERTLSGQDVVRFRRLCSAAESVVELMGQGSDEELYLQAGKKIVDESDTIFAIWDGKPAAGLGGTGDIVAYALSLKKQIVHLNTATKSANVLGRD